MQGILLLKLRLICILAHVRLIASDGEMASSITDWLNNTCTTTRILLTVL